MGELRKTVLIRAFRQRGKLLRNYALAGCPYKSSRREKRENHAIFPTGQQTPMRWSAKETLYATIISKLGT